MSDKEKKNREDLTEELPAEETSLEETPVEEEKTAKQKDPDKAKKDKAKADKSKKPSVGQRFSRFLREMKAELKKVSWPTRPDTMRNTGVVLVSVVVVALIVWVFDGVANSVVSALMSIFGH